MGNQTTSGIVEEEPAKNAASEKLPEGCSPDELKEENQTQSQENGTKDLQEKSENEEHNGYVIEDSCETQTDVKLLGRSKACNEEQDQMCTINGEMQSPNPIMDCTTHEAGGTTSELQEDQNVLVKEADDHVMEKEEDDIVVADTGPVGGPVFDTEGPLFDSSVDKDCTPQEDQNVFVKDIDDHHVIEKENEELVMADMPSVEGPLLETCENEDEVGKHDDHPHEEQCNSINALNDQKVQFVDQTEPSDQGPLLEEGGVGKHDDQGQEEQCNSFNVEGPLLETCENEDEVSKHEDHPHEEQCNSIIALNDLKAQFVEPSDQGPLLDEDEVGVHDDHAQEKQRNSLNVEGPLLETCENEVEVGKHDDHPHEKQCNSINALNDQKAVFVEPSDQGPLLDEGKVGKHDDSAREEQGNSLIALNDQKAQFDGQTEPFDQEMIKCDYTVEIDCLDVRDEIKDPNDGRIQVEDPILVKEDYEQESAGERLVEDSGNESTKQHGFASSAKNGVELRKCPSFDFGLSFRSEESDKTPLLYMERTPMRSLSSCSNPRFQNKTVNVEAKTTRMERSGSEELPKKGDDVITRIKQEVSTSGKKEMNGSMASPSGNNGDAISPKRRAKSSLFTTCICCTAAIS